MIVALKVKDQVVRVNAAKTLRKIKDPMAVEPLIAALRDENQKIRDVAVVALKEITGKNFGQDPLEWQKWWKQNKETIRNRR